jgi:hypothetical protein
VQQATTNPAGSSLGIQNVKIKLEQALHLSAAVVTLAAAFGLDTIVAAMSLAAISVGLAVSAGLPR